MFVLDDDYRFQSRMPRFGGIAAARRKFYFVLPAAYSAELEIHSDDYAGAVVHCATEGVGVSAKALY